MHDSSNGLTPSLPASGLPERKAINPISAFVKPSLRTFGDCSRRRAPQSVFPGENYEAPQSWAEQAYHNLIYYNKVDRGGHYAAWEQPQLFSEEVRAGLRPLRKLI